MEVASKGKSGGGRTVAIMQPYFFPYAGYFKLLALADEFVIFDCVQFRRRGRMHRTELPGPGGSLEWLTLPIDHGPREMLIRDVAFAVDAQFTFRQRLDRLDWVANSQGQAAARLREYLFGCLSGPLVDHLENGLKLVADILEIEVKFSRSSALDLAIDLRGQDRVLTILDRLGATDYVNLPGGVALYDHQTFANAGVRLSFLTSYTGPYVHMLHALMTDDPASIRRDVLAA